MIILKSYFVKTDKSDKFSFQLLYRFKIYSRKNYVLVNPKIYNAKMYMKRKSINLVKAIDRLEERFGRNIIKVGFTNKDVPNKQGFMTCPKQIY